MKYTVISFEKMSCLDRSSVSIFREKLAQVNTDNDAVLIDLTGVDCIDSRGLGAIISVAHSTRGETQLLFCGIEENMRRSIELAHLYPIMPLYSSVTAAIEMLQQEPRELKTVA
ncbi:MAG: anti-sigma factor antagonist [Candidatus Electrothrix sp. AR5]|nr:anti-sigma factor antagonist [Candidatus Electrothrix sp. AR5]